MATTKKQGGAMCRVTIGYQDFLMPADKGMRVLEAMQHAIGCDRDYIGHDEQFIAKEQPRVEFSLVRADQIRMPEGYAQPEPGRKRAPRTIQGNPTRRLELKS